MTKESRQRWRGNISQRMNCYIKRNEILGMMGFRSYQEYLESPLWASIYKAVIKHDTLCSRGECTRPATQVHHLNYSAATLAGYRLDGLRPVCTVCHRDIEIAADGTKRNLTGANYQFFRKPARPSSRKRKRSWQEGYIPKPRRRTSK